MGGGNGVIHNRAHLDRARREATTIRREELQLGAVLVLGGICLAVGGLPGLGRLAISRIAWGTLAAVSVGLGAALVSRLLRDPSQSTVRRTVGGLITLFVPLDAVAATAAAGWGAGLAVLLLLVPVRILARWTGQT